jgi:PAS domain S-box-containing protein
MRCAGPGTPDGRRTLMRIVEPSGPATWAAVLDALPIAAFVTGPDASLSYVSSGWKRLTGHDGSTALEAGVETFVHPDDRAAFGANFARARRDGSAYRDEFRLRFGDGAYRYVVSLAEPMRGAHETLAGWFWTITEIHDLRSVNEQLRGAIADAAVGVREAQARARFFERVFDAVDGCLHVLDLAGRLNALSANGLRAFGIADFAAVAGTDWIDFWRGDERAAAIDALAAARGGGRGRFTALRPTGERDVWWEVSVSPVLGVDGEADQLVAVLHDVTEFRQAYRELARSEAVSRVMREAMPGITWTASPDGRLDYVGGSQQRAPAGLDVDRLGDAWLATVHPADRAAVAERWAASVRSGCPYDALFRVLRANGQYRWQLVRALPQYESGAIVRWVGVNIDVDDQRRADEAREQFVRLAEASDDFISISDEHGNAVYVNEAGRRMLDIGSMDETRGTHMLDFFAPGDRAFVAETMLPTIARDGRWLGEYQFRNFRTGGSVPVWYNAFALVDDAGRTTGIGTVSRDLRERLRVEAGLRALAEAGASMYSSLDVAGTVKNVAEAVARTFASFCTVEALDADGRLRTIAAAHRDPAALPLVEAVAAARNLKADHPVARAVRYGDSTLIETVSDDWLEVTGIRSAVGDAVDRLDIRSLIFVPIRSAKDARIFGALCCVMDGSDPRNAYTPEDLRFAVEVAVRAGLALDHASAYEHERRIAVTLQEASLPRVLPLVDHLYLSADYHPGNSEATIGGDWYDAFELDDGRIAVTIGDVLGNGLDAAVTMGKVRQAMRAVASVIPDPNAMLDVADRTVRAVSDDTYATAMAGIFDPRDHTYTFASAGHPGPVVRYPDGRIEEFRSPGIMLGLRLRGETESVRVPAPPGTALVFFTDGLIEATRDLAHGQARLHAALADPAVAAAANPAGALVANVLDGIEATDDVAVLMAEVGPNARFDERRRSAAARAHDP